MLFLHSRNLRICCWKVRSSRATASTRCSAKKEQNAFFHSTEGRRLIFCDGDIHIYRERERECIIRRGSAMCIIIHLGSAGDNPMRLRRALFSNENRHAYQISREPQQRDIIDTRGNVVACSLEYKRASVCDSRMYYYCLGWSQLFSLFSLIPILYIFSILTLVSFTFL